MTKEAIKEKLSAIFHDVFDDESIIITESLTANEVDGWDSLRHITLISAIEDEFDMKFQMKDIVGMKNVGDLITIIEEEI